MKFSLVLVSALSYFLMIQPQAYGCDPYPIGSCDISIQKDLYKKMQCLGCHGETGDGNGDTMKDLPLELKARNFQEGRFKTGTCNGSIATVIQYGGDGVGLSATMHPQKSWQDTDAPTKQPDGCYESDIAVYDCLAKYIRTFKK